MNLNNGEGGVTIKNQIIIQDTLTAGKIIATKHANGRDWWINVYERHRDKFYNLLFTPNGIEETNIQDFGINYPDNSVGMAQFTPDGNKYIKYDLRLLPTGNTLDIYDFDRCTGQLGNNIHISLGDTTGINGGIAISPNSRFLYATTRNSVYQFDLWANDIEASKLTVAEFDGFQSEYTTTYFNQPVLAPDGKIYITLPGTDLFLHRINLPNLLGVDCQVVQRAINLPTFIARGLPNFPNYRLGPLDGSPCDTLGLDNHPLAGFTWETDSLTGIFSDNTSYQPTNWIWDFAGLGVDTLPNPTFDFPAEGNYNVCQVVANQYDSDTLCQEVLVSFLKAQFDWNAEELTVDFTDGSISEPFDWYWEFGDEATSTAQHPVHTYASPGIYKVCLTVMDEWAEVMVCDSVEVDIIDGVSTIFEEAGFALYPNPATNHATIKISDFFMVGQQLRIANIAGQVMETIVLDEQKIYQLDLSNYSAGVYWVSIVSEQQQVFYTEKLVVVR